MLLKKSCVLLVALLFVGSIGLSQKVSELEIIIESDTSSFDTKVDSYLKLIKAKSANTHDSILIDDYRSLSDLYRRNYQVEGAIKLTDEAISKLTKLTDKQHLKLLTYKAYLLKYSGKTDKAIELYLKVLAQYEEKGFLKESAKLNRTIGTIFKKSGDTENALYHLKEAVLIGTELGDDKILASCYMTIGNVYKNTNNPQEALENYNKSIDLCIALGDERSLAGNYNNLGSLYRMDEEYKKAITYYQRAVEINLRLENLSWLSYNYNNIGNVYEKQRLDKKALEYYEKSIEIKLKLNDLESLVETKKNMAAIYHRMGDDTKAYSLITEHITLKDSLDKANRVSESKKIAAMFQSEKREAEIKELSLKDELNIKELKAKDEIIVYQNFLGWLMGIGILLVVVIAFLLMFSARNRKRANTILLQKNKRIDSQHKEIIDSINYAKRIQSSILPSWDKVRNMLPLCDIIYKPKDIVSGDFYLCDETKNGTYFGVVDCTGHGVPGAMVSLVASNHINKALHELNLVEPKDVLTSLNKTIPNALISDDSMINDGMDVALCYLNKGKSKLYFAGANLNCLVINKTESIQNRFVSETLDSANGFSVARLKGDRQGIGRSYSSKPFTGKVFDVVKGDKILLTSDGFPDQFGGTLNKKFKMKEMRNIVLESAKNTTTSICEELKTALINWQGDYEQIDDVCVFLVEI